MPYFVDQNLEDEDKNKDPSQVQISGAAPQAAPSGGLNQQQPGQQKDLKTGSGFQNLDKYLQNNDANAFGSQVTGNVQNDINSAKESSQKAADTFTGQVNDLNKTPDQKDIDNAVGFAGGTYLGKDGQVTKLPTEKADPGYSLNDTGATQTPAASADDQAKQYQAWINQKYQGPTSVGSDFYSGAQKAATNAGLLGNEAGRFTLLDSYYGKNKPGYNFGDKSLDNLLLQQSNAGAQSGDLLNQATALQGQQQQQAQSLSGVAAQKQADVAASAAAAKKAADDAISGLTTGVTNRVTDYNTNQGIQYNNLQADIKSGHITPDDMKILGLGANQRIAGLDLNSYLTQGQAGTADNLATPEERARYAALEGLEGGTQSYFGSPTEVAAPTKTGFNTSHFLNDLNSAQNDYNSKAAAIQSQIDTIQNRPKSSGIWEDMGADSEKKTLDNLKAQLSQLTAQYNPNRRLSG